MGILSNCLRSLDLPPEQNSIAQASRESRVATIVASRSGRHQLHLWISDAEYTFLRKLARTEDEPIARLVRRLIRQMRFHSGKPTS